MTVEPQQRPLVAADEALKRLMEGNARFLRGESSHARAGHGAPPDLVKGQWPFATVLGCSDSRVPPEILFDVGFGELFIIRVAGNIISPEVVGSLQYAGTHLETQLFLVLGHECCGAVQAALAAKFQGARERAHIEALLKNLLPGLEGIDPQLPPAQQLESAVEANVRWSMHQLLELPEARARQAEGRMKLVGGIYEIATGRVRLLE
jgi:carbonic anhydrase